jgi:hypothetical protein
MTSKKFLIFTVILITFFTSAFAETLQEIVVKEGDTLWSVATYYLKDAKRWPEILKYNNLPSSDPNIILPGMKLHVPILLIKENLRAAILIQVVNDVRYRRQKEAEWNQAVPDMKLYNEDGLRTLQQSIAQVRFPSGEILKLDENSLVILRPEKAREEVNLVNGGLHSSKTKILTASSIVDPRIEPRGPSPDFKTKIKEDQSTLVEVFEGIVDVTAQGRTVTLTKGFGTEVKLRQPPSLPRVLPPQPISDVPQNLPKADTAKNKPPEPKKPVTTSLRIDIDAPRNEYTPDGKLGQANKSVTKYHLQISSAADFRYIAIDKVHTFEDKVDIKFSDYQLSDGLYYYRYAYIDDLGFEGRYTSPAEFIVDNTPPPLSIFPEKNSDKEDKFIHFEGKTESGALVKVNDKPIPVDDNGRFIVAILPQKAYDVVLVTAQDFAGNITKEEVVIDGKKISKRKMKEKILEVYDKKTSSFFSFSVAMLTLAVIVGVLVLIVK